jgi:hypothetical protein
MGVTDSQRLIDKYKFTAGDMIIDAVSGERGILISRKRMIGDMYNPSPLFVWEIAWFPPVSPKSLSSIWHPKEYPEHTLMLSIEEGDFSYYECPKQKTLI